VYGAGNPAAGEFTIASWYPQVPPVLASDTYLDAGTVAVPSTCNVAATLAQTGSVIEVTEARTRLDTIFGELETYQAASYVSSAYGVLCVVVNDDLQYYYDFSGQTSSVFNFSSTPLEETVLTETLGLQSAQLATANATVRVRRPSLVNLRAIVLRARAAEARKIEQRITSRKPQ
ncbi:MAG TPA: hypothetical protein VF741_00525, partial [Candidatus Aquilonibacter sp.]